MFIKSMHVYFFPDKSYKINKLKFEKKKINKYRLKPIFNPTSSTTTIRLCAAGLRRLDRRVVL